MDCWSTHQILYWKKWNNNNNKNIKESKALHFQSNGFLLVIDVVMIDLSHRRKTVCFLQQLLLWLNGINDGSPGEGLGFPMPLPLWLNSRHFTASFTWVILASPHKAVLRAPHPQQNCCIRSLHLLLWLMSTFAECLFAFARLLHQTRSNKDSSEVN